VWWGGWGVVVLCCLVLVFFCVFFVFFFFLFYLGSTEVIDNSMSSPVISLPLPFFYPFSAYRELYGEDFIY